MYTTSFSGSAFSASLHENSGIGEAIPCDIRVPFSFVAFGVQKPVQGFAETAQVIIEKNGIFKIADVVDPSPFPLDMTFKRLVDSIIHPTGC